MVDAENLSRQSRFSEVDRALIDTKQDLRNKKQELRQFDTVVFLVNDGKTSAQQSGELPKSGEASKTLPPSRKRSIDEEILEFEISCIEQDFRDLHRERERLRSTLSAARISIIERAEVPVEPNEATQKP